MSNYLKKYIIFWLSQSVSQLGSAMTSFALILWVYSIKHSAMTISLMSFFMYVPYIIVSLLVGTFIDKHSKKKIMLVSDSIAAACSVMILMLIVMDGLQIWHIYVVNCLIGFMYAFQSPASSVAIGRIVPKDKLANVSGMNSFSSNLINVLTPVLTAFLYSIGGLKLILVIDLVSFIVAFLVLLLAIHIPETMTEKNDKKSVFSGCKEGYTFLLQSRGLFVIVLTMALLNFFSRLTYENILSPMILSRSGNNTMALGVVNAAIGIGGIVGGILTSTGKLSKNHLKMIYVSAGVSFLLGDFMMGIGRNVFLWSLAGVAASLPIPFIVAGQNVILYKKVPEHLQGRVFAVRNAIQRSTVPIGILLGGFLADYVFEPFMAKTNVITKVLHMFVGKGEGSGMAVMFLCTGLLGSLFSYFSYKQKAIQDLEKTNNKEK